MAKMRLRGKELLALGYPEGRVIGVAINLMLKHYKRSRKEEVLDLLQQVLETPHQFDHHEVLGIIVRELHPPIEESKQEIQLLKQAAEYPTFGLEQIEMGALKQMETAMRLPVTSAGALMPDAHQGYGLPIGGVLAVENAVIPYGVGMDIGCRMCLSIYDLDQQFMEKNRSRLSELLIDNSRFGQEVFDQPFDDAVLARAEFKEIPKVKALRQKAMQQIGSSGSGNHFVEFGIVELTDANNEFGLPLGRYLGLLTHSGSRGLGANIAQHYTKIAMQKCLLPKDARHLAWLNLDSEEGQEYWLAMNLAGDYASACHHHIHRRINMALAEQPLATVENHHNFAWKEHLPDGREVIVHRKGATPAGKGVLGVIPGSMTAPGFIVRGTGSPVSLNSASHGAGRLMSRRKAKENISKYELKKHLRDQGVDLIGGGLDEAPFAYKDIHQVMKHQEKLVEVIGTFLPKIVRMHAG
ncbi:MAG: RNA-splicing ligase RtcB [Saprospiraceae bacterium]|nr:MAG: RNA-splicing ligase RtcB [Saprospiraceae bacterium]